MQGGRIMVVDDSEADLLYTQIVLERCGGRFDVVSFESGPEALRHLEREWPAVGLILLDINMPQMNGWEFLDAYAELAARRGARAALVMLTSSPDPRDRGRALSYPLVKGYVEKPLDAAQALRLQRFFVDTHGNA